jgi:predicted amidophosphoribosyltransferase
MAGQQQGMCIICQQPAPTGSISSQGNAVAVCAQCQAAEEPEELCATCGQPAPFNGVWSQGNPVAYCLQCMLLVDRLTVNT